MDAIEMAFELIMEAALLYVTYLFWQSWRETQDTSMLVLTWTFALIFAAHTAFAVIVEDIIGYRLPEPFDTHHILFLSLLLVIVYIQKQKIWSTKLRTADKLHTAPKSEREEKAS